MVVDTHCIRITSRLGFHSIKDANKIEKILRDVLPPEESNDFVIGSYFMAELSVTHENQNAMNVV